MELEELLELVAIALMLSTLTQTSQMVVISGKGNDSVLEQHIFGKMGLEVMLQ